MNDLLFHHYDASPFSEKIRLCFGHKGLAWRSVVQPQIRPQPHLVPLTGGLSPDLVPARDAAHPGNSR